MPATLNRIIVFVADVQLCASFYRDMFGFAFVPSHDPAEWQELDAGSCKLAFHIAHKADGPTGHPLNPHKIVFYAEDVEATAEQLKQRGVPMGEIVRYGDLVMCDGQDPENHCFQICNRP